MQSFNDVPAFVVGAGLAVLIGAVLIAAVVRRAGVTPIAKALSFLIGTGLIGAVLHQSIMLSGGYSWITSPFMLLLGAGIVAGSIAIGISYRERRRTVAGLLIAALCAGEALLLLLTAERMMRQRANQQAPIEAAHKALEKAKGRVLEAKAALASWTMSERLKRALDAKMQLEKTAAATSAERHCGRNCRKTLEGQVARAEQEVRAARTANAAERGRLEQAVVKARSDLAALPVPQSPTPLADKLGLEPWQVDLALALLASLSGNGLAAFLIAFAVHGPHREKVTVIAAPSIEVEDITPKPVQLKATAPRRNPKREADQFLGAFVQPSDEGRVPLTEIRDAYHRWCNAEGQEPLPDAQIGKALSDLFDRVGLEVEGEGRNIAVIGIDWREKLPVVLN